MHRIKIVSILVNIFSEEKKSVHLSNKVPYFILFLFLFVFNLHIFKIQIHEFDKTNFVNLYKFKFEKRPIK